MSMTETVGEGRRTIQSAASEVPAKAAAARAALIDLGERAKDLVAGLQARTREELDRRRSDTADRLENLADVLRPEQGAETARRRAAAGGSALAIAAVLGAGVALGLVLSWRMKKRAEQRNAAQAEAEALKVEAPPLPQKTVEHAPASAGLSH